MSSNDNDAFGVTHDIDEHQEHDHHFEHGHDDTPVKKQSTNGKFNFSELPMVGKLGIGAVGLLFLVIFGVTIGGMMRRTQSQPPQGSETVFQQVVKNEIATIKQSITQVQEGQADLNRRLEQFAINQPREAEVVTQRMVGIERSLNALHESVKTIAKRSVAERSLDFDLMAREDAHVVSIGNGIARVVDENGKEITLQKGDKFKGLLVRELLSDRRLVVLSDGSVIL